MPLTLAQLERHLFAAATQVLASHDQRIEIGAREASKLRLLEQALMEDLLTGRVSTTALLEGAVQ